MDAFADIEGPVRIGWLYWILIAGSILALLAIGVSLVRLWLRQRPNHPSETVVGPTAIERALQRLEKLRAEAARLEADPFTVEVSDIVRHYLEGALNLPAREQTTEEFLHKLEYRNHLPPAIPQQMPGFLEACDRVKFARQSLQEGERERLIETASTVIQTTDEALRTATEPASPSPAP